MTTFIDDVLNDNATAEQVDDYVERWHDGEGEGLPLHEFLGLTWNEYGAFVKDHDALDKIIEERRHE